MNIMDLAGVTDPDVWALLDALQNWPTEPSTKRPLLSKIKEHLARLLAEALDISADSGGAEREAAFFVISALNAWRKRNPREVPPSEVVEVVVVTARQVSWKGKADHEALMARLGVELCDLLIPSELRELVAIRTDLAVHLGSKGYVTASKLKVTPPGVRWVQPSAKAKP